MAYRDTGILLAEAVILREIILLYLSFSVKFYGAMSITVVVGQFGSFKKLLVRKPMCNI